jgi:hypothetical protein
LHGIITEFTADMRLAGRSLHTLDNYTRALRNLLAFDSDFEEWDLPTIKAWLADAPSAQPPACAPVPSRALLR